MQGSIRPDKAICRLRLEHNFELYHLVTTTTKSYALHR
nr:MAG TPA: hypothetical protein [Caudoviricetes sp.]